MPLLSLPVLRCGDDQAVLALEPFPLDEPVFIDRNPFLTEQGIEVILIGDPAEIDGGEVLELGFDELDDPCLLPEHGLEEKDLSVRPKPVSDPVENQFLVFEQHEAHAEEDEVEILFLRRLVALHRLVKDTDVIVKPTFADKAAAMVKVALVDIYADDLEVLRPDQSMVVLDHDTVADPHIQDPRIRREIMEAVVVTEVCHIINDQLVEVVFHKASPCTGWMQKGVSWPGTSEIVFNKYSGRSYIPRAFPSTDKNHNTRSQTRRTM